MLAKNEIEAIDILIKYRLDAGVEINNPYVFATPANSVEQFYRAGKALKDFCVENNLHNKNLSATKLRKQCHSNL